MGAQMEHWFIILLLLLFPLLFSLIIKFNRNSQKLNLPPSAPKFPIIGNLHQLGTLPHRSLRDLSQKYGPLMLLQLGSFPTLIVSSAQVVEEMLKQHDHVFASRPYLKGLSDFMYGGHDVVFSPYGDYWRQAKKICVMQLLSQKMVKELQSLRDEVIKEMLQHIHLSSLSASVVDFNDLFYTMANNIICRSATGDGPEGKEFSDAYIKVVREAQRLASSLTFTDLFPCLEWMDTLTGFRAGMKRVSGNLDAFMDRLIKHGMKINETSNGNKGFVSILLHLQREGKLDIALEMDDIKGILQSLFTGATDTVPSTLEWIMAEIVQNPSVTRKAQEEIQSVVGDKGKISEDDIEQMHYLKCVLKEAMRLHAFGLFPRETSQLVRLCGYDIPPKTRVMINNWAVQRDPSNWDRPDEFIPERFQDEQMDLRGQNTRFIPFGFGRRSCPGSAYAFVFAENVIANLLYWYDWKLPDGVEPEKLDMTERFAVAIYKKDPLKLVPVPRYPVNAN